MGAAGYDEEDVFSAIKTLVEWGLIEPESLIVEDLTDDDAVRMHATGFIYAALRGPTGVSSWHHQRYEVCVPGRRPGNRDYLGEPQPPA